MAKTNQSSDAAGGATQNRSEAIRQVLLENPKASAAEVVGLVSERYGMTVSPGYVHTVKSQAKRRGKLPKTRRMGRPRRKSVTNSNSTASPVMVSPAAVPGSTLDAAISFVESAGGLDDARTALDRLERLRGKL